MLVSQLSSLVLSHGMGMSPFYVFQAQAQECTVEKSLKGLSRIKNLNISKIAMKVYNYVCTIYN